MSQSVPTGGMPATQNRTSSWAPFRSGVLGLVLVVLLILAACYLRWIAAHIPPTPLTILTIAVCYGFYAIRKKRPLAYGATEFFIGTMLIFFATRQASEPFKDEAAVWALVFQLSAGVYIVVRGLDNISRSPFIKAHDTFRWIFECLWWRRWKE